MTTNISTLVGNILVDVMGCPTFTAEAAIRTAAINFCTKTQIWKNTSDATDVTDGESEYTFSPPTGAKVVAITYVGISGYELGPVTIELLDEYAPGWRTLTEARSTYYYLKEEGILRLVGEPSEDITAGLIVDTILKPSRAATILPTFLYEDWLDEIEAGAKAILQRMPKQTWTNEEAARLNERLFRRGIQNGWSRARKMGSNISLSVQPRLFGGVTGGSGSSIFNWDQNN